MQRTDHPVQPGLAGQQALDQRIARDAAARLGRQMGECVVGDDEFLGNAGQGVDLVGIDTQSPARDIATGLNCRLGRLCRPPRINFDDVDLIGDQAQRCPDLGMRRMAQPFEHDIAGEGIEAVKRSPGLAAADRYMT
ncbi:MAG: hypothetical protein WDN69_07000 [Aliidongia sp.]